MFSDSKNSKDNVKNSRFVWCKYIDNLTIFLILIIVAMNVNPLNLGGIAGGLDNQTKHKLYRILILLMALSPSNLIPEVFFMTKRCWGRVKSEKSEKEMNIDFFHTS